jgi:hypothetical protein
MEALVGDLERGLDAMRTAVHLGFVPGAWQARVLRRCGKRPALGCACQTGKSTTSSAVALLRTLRALS